LVLALFLCSSGEGFAWSQANQPDPKQAANQELDSWLDRAEKLAGDCEEEYRDWIYAQLAAVCGSSGQMDRYYRFIQLVKNKRLLQVNTSLSHFLVFEGNLSGALRFQSELKSDFEREESLMFICWALAMLHNFDEARKYASSINNPEFKNRFLELLSAQLAQAGKWREANAALDEIEKPKHWGNEVWRLPQPLAAQARLPPISLPEDPDIADAMNQAREYADHIEQVLSNPLPSQRDVFVTVIFERDNKMARLTLSPVRPENGNFVGKIHGDSKVFPDLKARDEINVSKDKLCDWHYSDEIGVVGYFTSSVDDYREMVVGARELIARLKKANRTFPPESLVASFAQIYRSSAEANHLAFTSNELESPATTVLALKSPSKKTFFWLAVFWNLIKQGDRNLAQEALAEASKSMEAVVTNDRQSSETIAITLTLVADAQLELGEVENAKALLRKPAQLMSSDVEENIFGTNIRAILIGALVRSGEMDLVLEMLNKSDPMLSELSRPGIWTAFGEFCVECEKLDYLDSSFERIPSAAAKAFVATGVANGIRFHSSRKNNNVQHAPTTAENLESTVRIPFTLTDANNISIRAVLNDEEPVQLMFHTAVDAISLTKDAVEKLKTVKVGKSIDVESWGGRAAAGASTGNRLKIAELEWKDQTIFVDEFSGPETDGKFGPHLFADKVIEINFDNRELVIHPTLPEFVSAAAAASTYRRLDFSLDHGSMYVAGELTVGDQKLTNQFMLHTGFGGTALLDDEFVQKNQLGDRLKTISERELKDAFGNVLKTKMVQLGTLDFGGIQFENVPVEIFDGALGKQKISVLGGSLIKRFNLVIDSQNHHLYLQPNKLFGLPYGD
jgi:uncharacterized protein YegJ (DUF2314 family)